MLRKFSYLLLIFICVGGNVFSLTIKLASPFPEATDWNNSLLKMAREWSEITDGLVRLKIYPGSIAGMEGDVIRKMRMGQLDAGVFSAFGLKMMVPETLVLTLPGLILNDEELNFILDNFVWRFDNRFREEGFEILAWSQSGWAHVFSEVPVASIEELKKQRLAVDNTDSSTASGFKSLGFNVVPVGTNEITVALQSGLADSVITAPMISAAFQWFALVPYMSEFKLLPVIGGLVFSRRVWLRVPVEYRDALRASIVNIARDFSSASLRLNDEAMVVMRNNGLQMVTLNDAMRKEWYDTLTSWHSVTVGRDIPAGMYAELLSEVNRFRSK